MTPAVQKGSGKEAGDVFAGLGLGGENAAETVVADKNENGKDNQSAEEKAAHQKAAEEQKKVVQPRTIKIGKKQEATPKKEVVESGQETAEQRAARETAAAQFEEKFNSTLGERFKADPKRILEVLDRLPKLEEQLKADPFSNPFIKTLDELVRKGIDPDTAYKFLKADVTKMTPREIMAFNMQLEHPGMDIEKINRQIDRKYRLGEYAPFKKDADGKDTDARDERDGLETLEFDVSPLKKNFDEVRNKTLDQSVSRSQVETNQKEADRVRAWAPAVEQVFSEFDTIEVAAPNGNKLLFDVELDDATRTAYVKELGAMIKNNPTLVNDERGLKIVKNTLRSYYIAQNFDKMAIAFAEQGRSMSDTEWMDIVHNPSIANTAGKGTDFGKDNKSGDDRLMNLIDTAEGGTKKKK